MNNEQSMYEKVYVLIKNRILSLEYAPGQKIEVQKLKKETGFSLSPIKGAINRLSGEGLLRIMPRKGTFVTEITLAEIESIMDFRLVLERGAIWLVLDQISDRDIAYLHAIIDKFSHLDPMYYYWEYMELDNQFHSKIIQCTKNKRLIESYSMLSVHFKMIQFHNYLEKKGRNSIEEHIQIIKAIESKDPHKMNDSITAHIQMTKKVFSEQNYKKKLPYLTVS